jgi:dTDP-4-dehydrorhamnose reductase
LVRGVTAVVVTGGSGQLASALAKAAPDLVRVVGRPGFDFDRPDSLDAVFGAAPPALLVNAAAWTAVDLAETEPDAAARANVAGPGRLAALCARHGTRLIHISTDYVFDGEKGAPYVETDAVNPTGVYGATKRGGEQAVLAALPAAVILRTAWVYAETGKNFVRTMLNAARKTDRLRVVADQRGCPTNADDLADAVLAVARRMLGGAAPGGIYHACGSGETTWHGFASAIFAAAGAHGWPVPSVEPIATADWPTPARRPADSRLDCSKLAADFGVRMPAWEASLPRAVAAICAATVAA